MLEKRRLRRFFYARAFMVKSFTLIKTPQQKERTGKERLRDKAADHGAADKGEKTCAP